MDFNKTLLASSMAIALGTTVLTAEASLTTGATLTFTLGTTTDPDCPPGSVCIPHITDIYGSYFGMDTNGNGIEANEKTPIESFNGIHIGFTQAADGSHSGPINGSESPNIDAPWTFFGGTGMHQTTSPITVTGGSGGVVDMSGWNVTWNGITSIPMVQQSASIVCSTASCSTTSTYTLDGAFHVNGAGFTTVSYTLHLEGEVMHGDDFVPIPATAWLFTSGLAGLIAIARRRKAHRV
jgi:hypothetical protein